MTLKTLVKIAVTDVAAIFLYSFLFSLNVPMNFSLHYAATGANSTQNRELENIVHIITNVKVTSRQYHDAAREFDCVVVDFKGSGVGILKALTDAVEIYEREAEPYFGRPYSFWGSLKVIRELRNRGWKVGITLPDTPLVENYESLFGNRASSGSQG